MEIDDIFASKKSNPIASSSAPTANKKKKKKKNQRSLHNTAFLDTKPKKRLVETVIDPSANVLSSKRLKTDNPGHTKSGNGKEKDDKARFMDSRGSGPRRKTEEGYSIYKEDELGMRNEGGDTPLCPFDCHCCY